MGRYFREERHSEEVAARLCGGRHRDGRFRCEASADADNVKITPLGSNVGEFCRFDRAMILKIRTAPILYNAGRTVAGPDDPRLGKIDVLLVSHMHGDHVGDRRIPKPSASACDMPNISVNTLPNTNTVDIALAKNAKIITGSEMPRFFASKLKSLGGDPKNSQLVRFGASRRVGGVTFTTVPAALRSASLER